MSKSLTLAMPIILAASVITISASMTTSRAADECLRGPNGTSPAGSHWYYRVDRSTGRHCWYLGAEGRGVRSVSERTSQQTRKRVEQHSRNSESATQPAEKRPDLPPPAPPVPDSKAATSFFAQYWASLFGNAEPPKIAPPAETAQVSPPAARAPQTAPQAKAPQTARQAEAPATTQQPAAPATTQQPAAPATTQQPAAPATTQQPEAPQTMQQAEATQATQQPDAPQGTQRTETPRLAAPAGASRPAVASAASNYAQEPEQADTQEDMPLVWPVLTPAQAAAAPALKYQHMIAILAGALALAGILMALVYRLASIRVDRQRRQPERAHWDPATRTMLPMPPLGDADAFTFPRSGVPARRLLLPKPLLPASAAELDRDEPPRKPLKLPFELDRELREPAWAKLKLPLEPAREPRKPVQPQRVPELDRELRKPAQPQRQPELDREARKPILPKRPPELERGSREPHEARRLRELQELREGLETRLEQLRDARRRSAA